MDADRLKRLDRMVREGTIIRHEWTDGHDRACLLAALAPECGEARSASACPADVMPMWLAELTPWIDDSGSAKAWPRVVRRYAALAHRWHVLEAASWRRLDYLCRAAALEEHARHVAAGSARGQEIDLARRLCLRVAAGYEPTEEELAALLVGHYATAAAAVETAAAAAAAARRRSGAAAAWAAGAAAWDRMADAFLALIEAECDAVEAAR